MRSDLQVAAFAFHEVTDVPGTSGFQRPGALRFTLTRQEYGGVLDRIAAGAQTPSLVTELDLTRPGRHLLLTFDDGGKSARHAADELVRRGWRGHFFVVTSLIGARTFLSAADIRQLRRDGHIIGTHSHTHPNIFRALPPGRMDEEWRVSTAVLSNLLGEPCLAGSVPGGDISRRALASGAEAGLRYLFTIEPRLQPCRMPGCWVLGRFSLRPRTAPARIDELLRYQGWSRALLVRRLKVFARFGCPPLYSYVVRRRTRPWSDEPPSYRETVDDRIE